MNQVIIENLSNLHEPYYLTEKITSACIYLTCSANHNLTINLHDQLRANHNKAIFSIIKLISP